MIKIIGECSTGKTGRLFLLAKENNGIVVCKNPESMRVKAHTYGLSGIEFMSYNDYIITNFKFNNQPGLLNIERKPVYIDEIGEFIKVYDNTVLGYTETK